MKKHTIIFLLIFCQLLFASAALAKSIEHGMRRQADANYRIAKRDFRKAVNTYGDNLAGITEADLHSTCRSISSALHDNRTQIPREDTLNQMKYKRQVKELEEMQSKIQCPRGLF